MEIFNIISQVAIFIFGGLAIWFVGRKEDWKRWGYIFGLLSQPFWFYATIYNEQWGMTILNIVYLYSWGQGFYNYWINEKRLLDFWYYKIVENLAWCSCELSFRMSIYFSNEYGELNDILIDWMQYQFYKLGCYLYKLTINYENK